MQEWRRLPLRPRRGQDRGQDSAHGACRQAGAVTRPGLRASAYGRRDGRGGRGEDPEAPPSRLAGPGEGWITGWILTDRESKDRQERMNMLACRVQVPCRQYYVPSLLTGIKRCVDQES